MLLRLEAFPSEASYCAGAKLFKLKHLAFPNFLTSMILASKAEAIVSEAAHNSKIQIQDIPANIGLEARAFAPGTFSALLSSFHICK